MKRTTAVFLLAGTAHAATYYAAPLGQPGGTGTPGDPFRSIAACTAVAIAGDTCLLTDGTYRETASPASGVTITAENPGAATIDGSDVRTGWRNDGQGFYSLPYEPSRALSTIQVFFNNVAGTQAQWPAPSADPVEPNWATMAAGTTATAIVDPNLPPGDLTGAIVHMFSGADPFTQKSAVVTASAPGMITIADDAPQDCGFSCAQPGGKYYLFGLAAFATVPTSWWYDGARLHILAPSGFDPNGGGLTVKARMRAVDLRQASNVTISNIGVFAGAIETGRRTAGALISGVTAQYVSQFDRLTELGNGGSTSSVSAFTQTTGIQLRGQGDVLTHSIIRFSAGNGVLLAGQGQQATDNLFIDDGLFGTYASPIAMFGGAGTTVAHNTVWGTPGYAIVGPGNATGNAVSYNNVYRSMTQRVDGASIYWCCGGAKTAGAQIDHNWVHDTTPTGYFGPGIYMDNGLGGVNIFQNISSRAGADAFYLNGATNPNEASGTIITNNDGLVTGARSLVAYNQASLTVLNNRFYPKAIQYVGTVTFAQPPMNNRPGAPGASDLHPDPLRAGVGCDFQGCATPR